MPNDPFQEFSDAARHLIDGKAKEKGYDADLFDFCHKQKLTHAEAEIVYKVVRYHNTKNPEDIAKVASWAYLIWRAHGKP